MIDSKLKKGLGRGLSSLLGDSSQKIETKFLGQFLSAAAPAYLVLKDVNVRKAPLTKSSRVGRFRKGVRISVAGKAKGTNWIAVRKDGKDFGFVYAAALAPVLDGSILVPVKGKLSGTNLPSCNYIIQYEGRKNVKGDIQIISDYAASISCNLRGNKIEFMANMFMTELPYRDLRKDVFLKYQVLVNTVFQKAMLPVLLYWSMHLRG